MNEIDRAEEVELIRLRVAERLGWHSMEYSRDGFMVGRGPARKDFKVVPAYASDIKAAWEIIELLTRLRIPTSIRNQALRGYVRTYQVEIGDTGQLLGVGRHLTAPMAICLAFLEAPESILADPAPKSLTGHPQRGVSSRL